MSVADIITASCAACGAIFLIPILLSILRGGSLQKKLYKYIFILVLFTLAGCLIELVWALFVGAGGGAWPPLVYLDYADYAFGSVIRVAFALYVHEYMSIRIHPSRIPLRIVLWLEAALILLITAARFGSLPGWLDDISRSMLIPFVSVVLALAAPIRNIRLLKKRELLSLLCYFFIPAACYLAEELFKGLWISYLGSAFGASIMFVNIHMELNQRFAEQEIAMTESRVAIMLSQIQPHFLYNTLTAIEYLCDRDGAKQAGKVARDFAEYLRGNIDSLSRKLPIPFINELEHTKLYLSIEQLQYEERLRVEYDLQTDSFSLPALTLQPLAENAVKHGVSKRDGGGAVKIRTEETESAFRVVVSDDGVGFDVSRQSADGRIHIGIDNVRRRLESVGGGLSVESEPGLGTTAIITIPKER